jgi:hypothetical protein
VRYLLITNLILFLTLLSGTSALAVSDQDIKALKNEIQNLKQAYESRITELENKLRDLEASKKEETASIPSSMSGRKIYGNEFNPSIGVILNGQYRSFSEDESEIAGFTFGHEGERGSEGFSVEHTELNFSANADDKFFGSVTAAIAEHEGETEVELEEAYVQTLPGIGLPNGFNVKAGRAIWTFGYLNEHHLHADDFSDRPLPYRVYLDNTYNDDGLEVTYVLPTDIYSEIGGGVFRGDDFPFGGAEGDGIGAWSAFARVGGDIGNNASWRLGGYVLSGEVKEGHSSHHEEEEVPHEGEEVEFIGDIDLFAADFRFTWAPTGNPREKELLLQGEYFKRYEDGTYEIESEGVAVDDNSSGWYVQGVYKFHQQWRAGARYSRLEAPDVPAGLTGSALDGDGHDPVATAIMVDWTNSEFSRIRLQYNHEELSEGQDDNQFILQYTMSLGAHGAHKY